MNQLKKLFKSFGYAFEGIFTVIKNERNMRIHLTCLCYMLGFLCFSDWFELTKTDWAILLLACGAVISGEIINTAIENAVDLASREHTEYGKIAKDAAAGAVLVSAIIAVAVGIIILFQPSAFKAMFKYFVANPLVFALFLLSIVPATLFIFLGVPFTWGGKK